MGVMDETVVGRGKTMSYTINRADTYGLILLQCIEQDKHEFTEYQETFKNCMKFVLKLFISCLAYLTF